MWVSCEDTSPDLGCYGDSYARTPNLDRLSTQGVRYQRAFSTYGVCAPSRSSIITGMYPTAIGTCHMRSQGVPPPFVKCFPEYLRAAGYYCTNNEKTDYNFPAPLTAWDDSSRQAHWRNRPQGSPFFSVFNLMVTHESQIRAPEDQRKRNLARVRPEDLHDPAKAVLPHYYPDTPVVRRDWANMHDNITAMDEQAGRLLKDLEDDGLADNTVVFFWGDHGRGLPRCKRWPYESGTRVPLLVRWPGRLRPGTVEERLVSLMDLGPTVLSIAGIDPPEHMHGRAFLGDFASPPRKYIFTFRDRMDETPDTIRAVRDVRYRYIRNYQPCKPYSLFIDYMDQMPTMKEMRRVYGDWRKSLENPPGAKPLPRPPQGLINFMAPEKPAEELYDCDADPHEVRNLAGEPAYRVQLEELRAIHEDFKKDFPDLGLLPEDQLKRRMRPNGVWQKTANPVIGRGSSVSITCPTEGASIAYKIDNGHWLLYSRPIDTAGHVTAKACRLGWLDSEEVTG